jgi:hypothetical protein
MGEPATLEVGMTEADFSNKNLGIRGAIIISAWITHKDKGALTVLDVSNNRIGLLTHAAWSDTGQGGFWTTGRRYQHVDGRKQDDKPEDVEFKPLGVIILANAIKDMGALLVLNLASNNLFAEGIELLAEALKGNQIMTELNVSSNAATWDGNKHGEMSGVIALADAIPDMRALTKLDISDNSIEQGKALQQIIEYCNTKGIELDNHESERHGGY